jgi:hypothetical protein
MTDKRLKRPRDPAQLAKLMIDIASGEVEDRTPGPERAKGRAGGLKASYCLNGAAGLFCGPAAGVTSNGQSRNDGWYAGGGFEYMVHKGALVDVILGAEYQHWDVSNSRAFCFTPTCNVNGDYDLGAKGDLVRARLTIKTQGYGWWEPAPVVAKY